MSESEESGTRVGRGDAETPQQAIVKVAEKLVEAREKRLGVEPDTVEEASISGYERGLRYALTAFENMDEIEKLTHLPEWQIGIENEAGEWEWYYPHALTRNEAVDKAMQDARDDLGDGPLNAYEVGGPIAR